MGKYTEAMALCVNELKVQWTTTRAGCGRANCSAASGRQRWEDWQKFEAACLYSKNYIVTH